MNNYMLVFRGGAIVATGLSPTDLQAHLQKWAAWIDGMKEKGLLADNGVRLHHEGKTLSGKNKTVTDGPYKESKDYLTGALVVQAESLEAATEIARGCPIFLFDGSVEVRQTVQPRG